MHLEIFSHNQIELLTWITNFRQKFYLVGGTAIALHLGHRRSLDFDLFTKTPISKSRIKNQLYEIPFQKVPLFEDIDQFHIMINRVKVTFFHYPFSVSATNKLQNGLKFPDLLTLAAMKSFALGRRAKWKDYVDLYFILNSHHSIDEINERANEIFGDQYAEKLFRQQLAFHKDIDYTETVDYLVEAPTDEEIKAFLVEKSISFM